MADKETIKSCTRTNSIQHRIFKRKHRPLSNISSCFAHAPIHPIPSFSLTVCNATLHTKQENFLLHSLPLPTSFFSPPGSRGPYVTLFHPLSRWIQQAMHITGHAAPPRRRRTPINPLESKSGTRQLPTGLWAGTRAIGGRGAIRTTRSSRRRRKRWRDLPAAAVGGAWEFVGGKRVAQLFVAGCWWATDGRAVWA